MDVVLHWPDVVPASEFSQEFLQGMLDRMAMSHFKYGFCKDAFEKGVDFYAEIGRRTRKYRADGNTEWLMDAANNAMIEFMHPAHPNAHFTDTDSTDSPGRVLRDGREIGHAHGDWIR